MPDRKDRDIEPIYLDHNATTPIAPDVAAAMLPYLHERFGNPSSSHSYGQAAKAAVEDSRGRVASLLGCRPPEVVFTGGGTESNNYAIKGAAFAMRDRGDHVVTSAVEHPAVAEVCRWLQERGFRVTVLPVDGAGLVDPADLEKAVTERTTLVSVMHANNEVGTIEPIAELAAIAHRHGALMHTDAAQSTGKIPADVEALGVDLMSIAGHKIYGPKGVGALYIRSGTELAKQTHGADHESDRRPGTENVPGIVGLGAACDIAGRGMEADAAHYRAMRDLLHEGLDRELADDPPRLNGHPQLRLPNTLNLGFRGVAANELLADVGDAVAASAGAACHSGGVDVSSVLAAMDVPPEWAMGAVRFSVGRSTTAGQIAAAVAAVSVAVRRLRP